MINIQLQTAHCCSNFRFVVDKDDEQINMWMEMGMKMAISTYILIEIAHMLVIFAYLKLWIAVARHNFKWVKI